MRRLGCSARLYQVQLRIVQRTRLSKSVNAIHGLLLHCRTTVQAKRQKLLVSYMIATGRHHYSY
jgi:hypothetical protein